MSHHLHRLAAASALALFVAVTPACGEDSPTDARAASPAPDAGAARGDGAVRPVGLRVTHAVPTEDQNLRPFFQDVGTTVALLLTAPADSQIIAIDDDSEVTAFADDKGTDLLKGESRFGQPGLASFPKISGDGKLALLEVTGPSVPAAGAGSLRVKGKLRYTTGSTKKTERSAKVKVAEGEKVEVGGIDFTLSKAGKPDWGDEPLAITLKATESLDRVAAVRFIDAEGNTIESSPGGSSSMRFGNKVTIERTYNLKAEADTVAVEIDLWTDMAEHAVELDHEIGLGM